jgi:hydroxyacylglutathione hydrolase
VSFRTNQGFRLKHGTPNVIPIPLGFALRDASLLPFVQAYVVRSADAWAVVDTGPPGNAGRILRVLEQHGVQSKIRLILLTHGHFDHYGSALELRRRLPGPVPIALHPADGPFLRGEHWPRDLRPGSLSGAFSLAFGGGAMLALSVAGQLPPWREEVLGAVAWLDELQSQPSLELEGRFGFQGRVWHTPGHSPGSLSLQLPTGEILTGDVISAALRRTRPRSPMLLEDRRAVGESWQLIARQEPTVLFPGHGGPFSGADFIRAAANLTKAGI